MVRLGIEKIGNEQGVIITKNLMERLNARIGDVVMLDDQNETISLSQATTKRERIMSIAHEVMQEDDNLLKPLAQ